MGYNHDELSMHPAALMRISGCEIDFSVLVQHYFYGIPVSNKIFRHSTGLISGKREYNNKFGK